MAKSWCNEAESYLVQHWPPACLMEETMQGVRKKYTGVFARAVETVRLNHQDFDDYSVRKRRGASALPQERLLEMLVEGDAQPFVDYMVRHLGLLVRFTPVVDRLLAGGKDGGD